LTAERNAGELEGDLWEDIELEMHIEEVMDTMPQISDDQSDTQSSQSEDLEPKSMELSINAVFFGFEAEWKRFMFFSVFICLLGFFFGGVLFVLFVSVF
jgi:hypothetical protein